MQGTTDPIGMVCVAKLCFSGHFGSGLPPEKDYLKIGQPGVELLSVKVSKRQNIQCFVCTAQGIADPKRNICVVKLCFSGHLGSGLPPEKDCLKIGSPGEEL